MLSASSFLAGFVAGTKPVMRHTVALEGNYPFLNIFEGNNLVFTGYFKVESCCGVYEFMAFRFYNRPSDQKAFNAELLTGLRTVARMYRKGLFHLTLTKTPGEADYTQPQWFVDAINSLPRAVTVPIVLNPNSGNRIEMHIFPTGEGES